MSHVVGVVVGWCRSVVVVVVVVAGCVGGAGGGGGLSSFLSCKASVI